MAPKSSPHCFEHLIREIDGHKYFSIVDIDLPTLKKMPYCMRVILEAVVRTCDGFEVSEQDLKRVMDWQNSATNGHEIAYKPARVLLQDFTGVPCIVDLAAMRSAMIQLGGDPAQVNPLIPTDLVIDHSVAVDVAGVPDALQQNEEIEFDRNAERFAFLKWGQKAFHNMSVVPPGSGIVHQVNLEYLARVVFSEDYLYPDSLVGTDSHTTMIDGLGVLGWGVGGIEAEATMLGQPIYMVVPEVVGFCLIGELPSACTTTDLVLKVTQMLRAYGVVGKLVEFYGPGVETLTVADRATISNMSPEFGATAAFFPCDAKTLAYLRMTGRDEAKLRLAEKYLRENRLFREYGEDEQLIQYMGPGLKLDLSTLVPAVAGPKRPHDFCQLSTLAPHFRKWLTAPVGFKGYGLAPEAVNRTTPPLELQGQKWAFNHGAVVIAAITSCTNTSNPIVMIWAGMLARNAISKGLVPPKYVKCSLSPGSHVVFEYLKKANLIEPLAQLGFYTTGFGCQTCIGNSGDIDQEVGEQIVKEDLVACAVLSGNRNFEGRIHPLTRANFLMSPPLVVAFALAGRVDIDFEQEPIGKDSDNKEVFLRDIWPSKAEVDAVAEQNVTPDLFAKVYAHIRTGNKRWQETKVPEDDLYQWDPQSTYIHHPPFFEGIRPKPEEISCIKKAYCLLSLGDSITTDHISPAGKIALDSPAARYLQARKVAPKAFNSYGSRRGNDEVMVRGTFANVRLVNKMINRPGPIAKHIPTGEELSVYDAAMKYRMDGHQLIILADSEYGCGSSRDWAAKGPMMLGVRAVIARSFERIHRSNLIGMGILPLQFQEGQCSETLGLNGTELYTIDNRNVKVGGDVEVTVETEQGVLLRTFIVKARVDTPIELSYYSNYGILQYVLRKMAKTI